MAAARLNAWGVSSLMFGAAVLSGCATQQGAAPVKAPAAGADPVQVYAAGSLRDALAERMRRGQEFGMDLRAGGGVDADAHGGDPVMRSRHYAAEAPAR